MLVWFLAFDYLLVLPTTTCSKCTDNITHLACPRGCLTCAGPNLGCTSCPVGYALSGPTGDVTTYCAQIPVAVGTDDEGSDAEEDFLYVNGMGLLLFLSAVWSETAQFSDQSRRLIFVLLVV